MKADRDQNAEVALARKRQEEAMRINLLREQAQRGSVNQVHVGSSTSFTVRNHLISIPGATTSTRPSAKSNHSGSTGTNSAGAASNHATTATIAASGATTSQSICWEG